MTVRAVELIRSLKRTEQTITLSRPIPVTHSLSDKCSHSLAPYSCPIKPNRRREGKKSREKIEIERKKKKSPLFSHGRSCGRLGRALGLVQKETSPPSSHLRRLPKVIAKLPPLKIAAT